MLLISGNKLKNTIFENQLNCPIMSKCGGHLTTSLSLFFFFFPLSINPKVLEWVRWECDVSQGNKRLLSHPLQSPIETGWGEMVCIAKSWRLMVPAASKWTLSACKPLDTWTDGKQRVFAQEKCFSKLNFHSHLHSKSKI